MKIMNVNRLDAHDRMLYFTKQDFDISACCQDIIDQRPFGNHPFYIFAHARTEDNDLGKKRLIWQPRLTKPKAESNSMLFKAYPGTDNIKIIWMIPAVELWKQYQPGFVTQSKIVIDSIRKFQFERIELEKPEPDDLTEEQINAIYKEISRQARQKKKVNEMGKQIIK